MSILIKGMGIPTAGLYIVSVDNTNGRDKIVSTIERMLCIRDIRQIVGTFELVHVPAHGRLGDLDELAKQIEHDRYHHTHTDGLAARHHIAEYGHFLKEIAAAPTIIPAEPPKEET